MGICRAAFAIWGNCFGATPDLFITYGHSAMAAQVPVTRRACSLHYKSRSAPITRGVGSIVEAGRIFAALPEGGVTGMPFQERFWAHRLGVLTDKLGKPWMVNDQTYVKASCICQRHPRDTGDLDALVGQRLGLRGRCLTIDAAGVGLAVMDAPGLVGKASADILTPLLDLGA